MSEQVLLRRPVLLVTVGLASVYLIYTVYSIYGQKPPSTVNLHRSNAVRRPRTRWRHGHTPRHLTADPTAGALLSLNGRIAAREAYGLYVNRPFFNMSNESIDAGHFDLLPQNFGTIHSELSTSREMTDIEKDRLKQHIEYIFVQNFLQTEYPSGYIIGEEVESLVHALGSHGITEGVVRETVARFDAGGPLLPVHWDLRTEIRLSSDLPQTDGVGETMTPLDGIEALGGSLDDDGGGRSHGDDNESDPGGSQGMLDLLYHIAGEQAKREGLIHRGVECNSCGMLPIRGIRYHCANCFDYDLCESCEAQQNHTRNHVFYKIRIPAPSRGHIKQVAPVWYPGDPNLLPSSIPADLSKVLMDKFRVEKTELESYYEQFKCLAGRAISREDDATHLGAAIDRKGFDLYFTTSSTDRPPPQNLLYDRIWAFYDLDHDDLITFDEFVDGMTTLQIKTRAARLTRMFAGYDLDNDGYVDRRDFLRMLRAYYAWHKEVNREMIMNKNDLEEDIRDAVHNSHPLSQAFGWNEYSNHVSRGGQDKEVGPDGDLIVTEGPNGVLQNESDLRGDRPRAIGNAAVRGQIRAHPFRSFRQDPERDEPVMSLPMSASEPWEIQTIVHHDDVMEDDLLSPGLPMHVYGWPPVVPLERDDIIGALGTEMPVDEIMDPTDRARIIYAQAERTDDHHGAVLSDTRQSAVRQRWQRRQFYLDEEEGMSKPPGYTEPSISDNSDNDDTKLEDIDDEEEPPPATTLSSRRQSMRSRSSSKVRFDDSAIDTDYETRSNTSSRSIPVNERWGGFELSEPEKDIGKEILYQAVQQGFNEMLDPLFKQKEDEAMEVLASKALRMKWQATLDAYEESLSKKAKDQETALRDADMLRTEALMSGANDELFLPEQETGESKPEIALYQADPQLSAEGQPGANSSEPEPVIPVIIEPQVIDPTLPQNRPNDTETTLILLNTIRPESRSSNTSALSSFSSSSSSSLSADSYGVPSESVLKTWIRHRAIDAEAKLRGGYGKLSFREFRNRMVTESIMDVDRELARREQYPQRRRRPRQDQQRPSDGDDRNNGPHADPSDQTGRTWSERARRRRELSADENDNGAQRGTTLVDLDMDIGEEDDEEEEKMWNSTADMGRLSFLGTWLEMAQF